MPSQETYRSYLDISPERYEQVPDVIKKLYADEQALALYQVFKDVYAGDVPRQMYPEVIRQRDVELFDYSHTILAAITDDGGHFINVRAGHSIDRPLQHAGDPAQFFVATIDIKTGQFIEWDVTSMTYTTRPSDPKRLSLTLEAKDGTTPIQARYEFAHQKAQLFFADNQARSFIHTSTIDNGLWLLRHAEEVKARAIQNLGAQSLSDVIDEAA